MTLGEGESINSQASGGNRACVPGGRQRGDCLAATNPIKEFLAGRLRITPERALPDNTNTPPVGRESSDSLQVSCLVPTKLLVPEISTGLGKPEELAAFMAVPEAAVDEDHSTPSFQHQVRFAGKSPGVKPVTQASPP